MNEEKMKLCEKEIGINQLISANLARMRAEAGLSLREVGDMCNVRFQQVQKYEKGLNRVPVAKMVLIAEGMDVSLDGFLRELEK